MRVYQDIHEAYIGTLNDVLTNPDGYAAPRGQKTREKYDYQFKIINPTPDIIITNDPERNLVIEEYSKKEFDLYESCSNKVEDFSKASKFWEKICNPDGTVNSAYGFLIWKNQSCGGVFETYKVKRTPWEWAKECLIRDKDSRQAILRFSLPEHQWLGNKDQTCTLHGMFSIRDNALNLCINMRSNDLMLGLVYDLPWFINLMYKMRDELKDVYKDLRIGYYTHYVHNIHIYEKDVEKITKMIGGSDETIYQIKKCSETIRQVSQP
jgi:thymidylate synthase